MIVENIQRGAVQAEKRLYSAEFESFNTCPTPNMVPFYVTCFARVSILFFNDFFSYCSYNGFISPFRDFLLIIYCALLRETAVRIAYKVRKISGIWCVFLYVRTLRQIDLRFTFTALYAVLAASVARTYTLTLSSINQYE